MIAITLIVTYALVNLGSIMTVALRGCRRHHNPYSDAAILSQMVLQSSRVYAA